MSEAAEAEVARVEALATRIDTPCGEGSLAWRVWGSGEPLVVAHGGTGSWSHWIRNVEVLARTRRVIAVDLPGHGDSALPETADHDGISAALAAGMDAVLGAGGSADFAGFSFGGVAFAQFALRHPERVRRLVIVGSGGLDTPHGHIDVQPVRGLEGEERTERLRLNLLGLMLHHRDTVDDLALHLLQANARKARLPSVPGLVIPDRLVRVLPDLRVPLDAIWGEFDRPHPDPALQEAVIRRHQPDTVFRVVEGSGHWAMYERPRDFEAALLDILSLPVRKVGA